MVSAHFNLSHGSMQTKNLINGHWVKADSRKTFQTFNPATTRVLADVADSGEQDVDIAVRAAHDAFHGPWSKFTARERGKLLFKLADLVEKHAEELATLETMNNGKPIAETRAADLPLAIATFRYYAGLADKLGGQTLPVDSREHFAYIKKEPVGVCGQIIPWNFPILHTAWKWGPALATGNTVVFKPAEQTPLTPLRLGELALEAGFPPGVINIVNGHGDVGEALVRHPLVNKISFTGHYKTGQKVTRASADTLKRLTLELGGKSPNVVFADADMDEAVNGAIKGIFFNQGEVCCAGSRLFVEAAAHDEFVEKFRAAAKVRRIGDPLNPDTEQGAQVSQDQYDQILRYIDIGKEEAELTAGGSSVGDEGWFIEPTIFTGVNNRMRIAQEEVFGPVVAVIPFERVEDVIMQANDSMYGLAAAAWTRDITKAFRLANEVRAGTVWVNCYNTFDPAAPFGGFKYSGYGRDCGMDAIQSYTESKTIWIAT